MKSVASLALLVCAVLAAPNVAKNNQENGDALEWKISEQNGQLQVNVNVGVPAQAIPLVLNDIHTDRFLTVTNKNYGGTYDSSESRTYRWYGSHTDQDGEVDGDVGVDDFQIGDVTATSSYFVDSYRLHPNKGSFGLGLNSARDDDFLRHLFKATGDQKVVIGFDDSKNGAITFGTTVDNKRCYKIWKAMPLATFPRDDGYHSWGVNISKISIASYSASNPGHLMFTLNDDLIRWPREMYAGIMNVLGSEDGQFIECSVTKTIDFQVGGVTVSLPPSVYLDRDWEDEYGLCSLAGATVHASDEFVLPRSFFNEYCISIDYKKKEIGLASRHKTKN